MPNRANPDGHLGRFKHLGRFLIPGLTEVRGLVVVQDRFRHKT